MEWLNDNAWFSLLVAGLGLLAAALSAYYARQANSLAKDANTQARRSADAAVEANIHAATSATAALEANKDAREERAEASKARLQAELSQKREALKSRVRQTVEHAMNLITDLKGYKALGVSDQPKMDLLQGRDILVMRLLSHVEAWNQWLAYDSLDWSESNVNDAERDLRAARLEATKFVDHHRGVFR